MARPGQCMCSKGGAVQKPMWTGPATAGRVEALLFGGQGVPVVAIVGGGG